MQRNDSATKAPGNGRFMLRHIGKANSQEVNKMINTHAILSSRKRQTKAHLKTALRAVIEGAYSDRESTIESMKESASNPQVAAMIERNKGYMAALRDVLELLDNRGIL